jgi:DnaK suppressor protein
MADKISTQLPLNYDPLKDPVYMSSDMRLYFREKLLKLLEKVKEEEDFTSLHEEEEDRHIRGADYVDDGKADEAEVREGQLMEYHEKLKQETEYALHRIDMNAYGYCEETNAPIGVRRLLAFPTARYTAQVQQGKEDLGT